MNLSSCLFRCYCLRPRAFSPWTAAGPFVLQRMDALTPSELHASRWLMRCLPNAIKIKEKHAHMHRKGSPKSLPQGFNGIWLVFILFLLINYTSVGIGGRPRTASIQNTRPCCYPDCSQPDVNPADMGPGPPLRHTDPRGKVWILPSGCVPGFFYFVRECPSGVM